MHEDLEYVAAAYEGRCEMLEVIFGAGSKDDGRPPASAPASRPRPLTPDAFDRMFSPGNDNEQ